MAQQGAGKQQATAWAPGQTTPSYLQGGAAIPPGQSGNPGMLMQGGVYNMPGKTPYQFGGSSGANTLMHPPGTGATGTTAGPSADVMKQMFQLKQQQGNQVGQWSNIGGQMQFQPQNQMNMMANQSFR